MNLFFVIFLSLFAYINYSIGIFYSNSLQLSGNSNIIFWIIHLLASSMMIAAPIVYRSFPKKKSGLFYNALQWIGYTFLGIYSILIIFVLLISFSSLFNQNIKFLLAVISLVSTGLFTVMGHLEIRKKPRIKHVKVSIDHLPASFNGLKILQLSDIHIGQTIKRDFSELLVEISNSLNPDIVVLTGDLVDGSVHQLGDEVEPFKKMKAPMGKFMIPGNHEYYSGVNDWIKYWQGIGFSTLLNNHQLIEKEGDKILMAGVHDYSAARIAKEYSSSPSKALEGSPNDLVKILLAHQPRSIYEASKAGFDLQLSGHTHSGQYFPYNFIIYLFQPYVKGLKRHNKTWIYVNQGTGYWGPPNRFGAPPEISLIELTNAPL